MKKTVLLIGKFLIKIPRLIADNVFISGFFVFLMAFILSGFLFYGYVISSKKEKSLAPAPIFQINGSNYQKFLEFRQNQDEVFNGATCQNCRDIFKGMSTSSE